MERMKMNWKTKIKKKTYFCGILVEKLFFEFENSYNFSLSLNWWRASVSGFSYLNFESKLRKTSSFSSYFLFSMSIYEAKKIFEWDYLS